MNDDALGMNRPIDRRDFLDGMALAVGASALGACVPLQGHAAAQDIPGYYPPRLTGLRGSHPGSFEAAHGLRDGNVHPEPALDTGEHYDLVIVGGGISGLAAAWFWRAAHPGKPQKILILDNNDDFGGHAKRNEFELGGKLHLLNGGTLMIDSPRPYSAVAAGLLTALGIDPVALTRASMRPGIYAGLGQGVAFDRAMFGVDRLVAGAPSKLDDETGTAGPSDARDRWQAFLAQAPVDDRTRADVLQIEVGTTDWLPGLDDAAKKDLLSRISYRDFLLRHVGVAPATLALYQKRTHGEWATGIDAITALDCWGFGLPGFQGMKLVPKGHPRMSFTPRGYIEGGSDTFHFPDGNATIARLLVRGLVPGTLPGRTAEDSVTAPCNYTALDRPANEVRIRLSAIVLAARHRGDPAMREGVDVTYVRDGTHRIVRGRQVILACWNAMIPYLVPELPERQKAALHSLVKAPLVYTSVALTNWQPFKKLGVRSITAPGGYFSSMALNAPVDIGNYRAERDPGRPILLHLTRTPCAPGLPEHDQNRAGRAELLATPFTTFERELRMQLGAILGPAGFDPARDITGITVNRWPHGYAPEYNYLWQPEVPEADLPHIVGRARFGRIAIANSDAGGGAYTDVAIDQARRAVDELMQTEAKG